MMNVAHDPFFDTPSPPQQAYPASVVPPRPPPIAPSKIPQHASHRPPQQPRRAVAGTERFNEAYLEELWDKYCDYDWFLGKWNISELERTSRLRIERLRRDALGFPASPPQKRRRTGTLYQRDPEAEWDPTTSYYRDARDAINERLDAESEARADEGDIVREISLDGSQHSAGDHTPTQGGPSERLPREEQPQQQQAFAMPPARRGGQVTWLFTTLRVFFSCLLFLASLPKGLIRFLAKAMAELQAIAVGGRVPQGPLKVTIFGVPPPEASPLSMYVLDLCPSICSNSVETDSIPVQSDETLPPSDYASDFFPFSRKVPSGGESIGGASSSVVRHHGQRL
jgi:hypothetical protein